MADNVTALPPVVSRDEWLVARKALLAKEKEATRQRDEVNALRRRLPMVRVDKDYVFESPDGKVTLLEMFEGRRQLYIHHFMWMGEHGCHICTAAAELNFNEAHLAHLHQRDITFAAVSRVPQEKIDELRTSMGWTFPWYSSFGNDFHYDFNLTIDDAVKPVEYNYRNRDELEEAGLGWVANGGDFPGNLVFIQHDDEVFHAYSTFARGLDQLFTPYNFLDITPYGRQEDWEDSPAGWPQRPTYG